MIKTNGNKIAAVVILAGMLLFGVLWSILQPSAIEDAESVRIVTQGRSIAVYDLLSGQDYHFRIAHARRADAPTEPQTAVHTPTIKIELIPGGGLSVESDGSVYRITPKAGRCG